MQQPIRACLMIFCALFAQSCGGDDYDAGGDIPDTGDGTTPECLASSECPTGWSCNEFFRCEPPPSPPPGDSGDVEPPPPPPPEIEYEFSEPASSLRFVYVAMTELDALAKIDGQSLSVTSLSVGEAPKVVVAAPGTDTAVVLDSVNGTATIVRPTSVSDEKTTFATLPHLNQLVVDPSGRYAVAWFDLNKAILEAGGIDFVDQIGSFQDVTILSLIPNELAAVDLTVGFRPREVEFDDAGTRAYVVTEDGVSVIDLADAVEHGPSIVPPIPLTDDPLTDPNAVEIDVVSTGEYAVVREAGAPQIRILRVAEPDVGTSWVVPLPGLVTDLDLSPDGSRAYAVVRETSELAVIDVPGDGVTPSAVDFVDLGGVIAGSLVLSRDGARGVLFTNATLEEELTVVELNQPGFPVVTSPLEKSVRTVAFDPTGDKLMITHAKAFGDPAEASSFEEFIDKSYGYSVFDISEKFAKLQITPVDPSAMSFAPSDPLAYQILDGGDDEGAVAEVQIIELDTGVVRAVELGSPPEAVGVLPDADVTFVSQRHPLGRISFINITTGETRTITGFDLNSRIID